MAYVSHTVIQRAIEDVKRTPLWQDAIDIARKNTYGKVYLVGGWVYRSITDRLYNMDGKPVEGDIDYDFLLTAKAHKQWLPLDKANTIFAISKFRMPPPAPWYWQGGLRPGGSSYSYPNATRAHYGQPLTKLRNTPDKRIHSATAVHNDTLTKVDLISLKDITRLSDTKLGSIGDYFNAVPLDVQAVAYDLEADMLLGPGIKAIQSKVVSWNNQKNLNPYHYAPDYIASKAKALGFAFKRDKQINTILPHKCTCTHKFLWEGCKCGGK